MWLRKVDERDADDGSVDFVPCDKCKSQLLRKDAYKVISTAGLGSFTIYYCGICKPPYDETQNFGSGTQYYKTNQRIQVNKDGTPYKEKKIKNN